MSINAVTGGRRVAGGVRQPASGTPRITIATVVFNAGAALEDTIRSVLALSYKNIEFIVIDGGSTDGTVEILRRYDSFLDYWVSEPDRGIYDAMNKAWQLASDDASILFLGAGDRILSLPDGISGRDIYCGDVYVGEKLFVSHLRRGLRLGNTVHHQALLIPKRLHPLPPFDTRFPVYADFDFNLRLYQGGHAFIHVPELQAYALPDGVSARIDAGQLVAVVRKNCGALQARITALYLVLRRFVLALAGS